MASNVQNAGAATIGDLGQELLTAIFLKLGPSPMHLAALSCVCKNWRRSMEADIWRQLCLEAAPGLCSAMSYDEALAIPPGGWLGFYKLLLYCPGLETSASREYAERLSSDYMDILGHMHQSASGFQTGPQIIRDLGLEAQFMCDVLFLSTPCLHAMKDQQCGARGLLGMVFRGVIQRFEFSKIARRIGAGAYLDASGYVQKQLERIAKDRCAYCRAPLVELPPTVFDNPICDNEQVPRNENFNFQLTRGNGVTVSGHCCLNGHLIGVFKGWDGGKLLNREVLPGSGAGLSLETCRVGRVLSSALLPNPPNCSCDTAVKDSLDAFSASRRISRLVSRIKENRGMNNAASAQKLWPEGETQVEYEIRARQDILDSEIDWIVELCKADLANFSDPEVEIDSCNDTPFWRINEKDLAQLKNFLDSIPKSEGIFLEYLKLKEHTVSITLERIQRLQVHNLKDQELKEARRTLIETALAALGVKVATRGRLQGQWPDPLSVERYIQVRHIPQLDLIPRTFESTSTLKIASFV